MKNGKPNFNVTEMLKDWIIPYLKNMYQSNPSNKKQFFNFFKLWYSDPFNKYVDEHPEFLDTKDIKIIDIKDKKC